MPKRKRANQPQITAPPIEEPSSPAATSSQPAESQPSASSPVLSEPTTSISDSQSQSPYQGSSPASEAISHDNDRSSASSTSAAEDDDASSDIQDETPTVFRQKRPRQASEGRGQQMMRRQSGGPGRQSARRHTVDQSGSERGGETNHEGSVQSQISWQRKGLRNAVSKRLVDAPREECRYVLLYTSRDLLNTDDYLAQLLFEGGSTWRSDS